MAGTQQALITRHKHVVNHTILVRVAKTYANTPITVLIYVIQLTSARFTVIHPKIAQDHLKIQNSPNSLVKML